MKVVKPAGEDRATPRGVVGGAEISQATTGATNIYMGVFRVPAGAQSRPHYHESCESAVYMLSGRLEVKWGDQLEQTVRLEPGDMVYVPPRETHLLTNLSDAEAAEYVVARDSPTEDSVEVRSFSTAAVRSTSGRRLGRITTSGPMLSRRDSRSEKASIRVSLCPSGSSGRARNSVRSGSSVTTTTCTRPPS